MTWLLDPLVAVHGHISLAGRHLAGLGRLARASALLLMYGSIVSQMTRCWKHVWM